MRGLLGEEGLLFEDGEVFSGGAEMVDGEFVDKTGEGKVVGLRGTGGGGGAVAHGRTVVEDEGGLGWVG